MYPYSSIRGNISPKAVVREQKQASTSRINLLLLMPFACTSRIKGISPLPWPSPPEPCSHSWCTQGPSTGSTLRRTRGRAGYLHVLPKVGSFQPPKSQEFPFVICPLLSSFLAMQVQVLGPVAFLQRPYWSPCSSSLAITTSHNSCTCCINVLTRAHLPQMKPALSPMKPASTQCSQDLDIHILSQELFLVKVCDVLRTLSVSSLRWTQYMACHCVTQPSVEKVQALPPQPATSKALVLLSTLQTWTLTPSSHQKTLKKKPWNSATAVVALCPAPRLNNQTWWSS